jgi:hypothetical protein
MGIRRGWKHHFRRDEAKLFGSKNIETGRTLERDTLNFQFRHRMNFPLNQGCLLRPSESTAKTQPKLQLHLLRLSAMMSQYFTAFAGPRA